MFFTDDRRPLAQHMNETEIHLQNVDFLKIPQLIGSSLKMVYFGGCLSSLKIPPLIGSSLKMVYFEGVRLLEDSPADKFIA